MSLSCATLPRPLFSQIYTYPNLSFDINTYPDQVVSSGRFYAFHVKSRFEILICQPQTDY